MSNSQDYSFFNDQTPTNPNVMSAAPLPPKVVPDLEEQQVISEDDLTSEGGCGGGSQGHGGGGGNERLFHLIKPSGISYSSQQYADMKGNPSMSYEYSSGRAAAGYPTCHGGGGPQDDYEPSHTGKRHYKTADDHKGFWPDQDPAPVNMSPRHRVKFDGGGDPSKRPAAGCPSVPNNTEAAPTTRHHYQMTGDAPDMRMEQGGAPSSPRPGSREAMTDPTHLSHMSPSRGRHHSNNSNSCLEESEEIEGRGGVQESGGHLGAAGQGQGWDTGTPLKTGKRHYKDGNASQPLW